MTLAAYDRDAFLCMGKTTCAAPTPTGFAPDPVVTAVAEWVYLDAPQVAAYFSRAHMPFAEMNLMLKELGDPGATIETVADRFIAERGEGAWHTLAGCLVASDAIGGVDFFALGFQFIDGPGLARIVRQHRRRGVDQLKAVFPELMDDLRIGSTQAKARMPDGFAMSGQIGA